MGRRVASPDRGPGRFSTRTNCKQVTTMVSDLQFGISLTTNTRHLCPCSAEHSRMGLPIKEARSSSGPVAFRGT